MSIYCNAEQDSKSTHPQILYISAYAYDWASVPYQLQGITSVLGSSSEIEYVFMNTKKVSYDEVKKYIYDEVRALVDSVGRYDLIIVEDDAALDFALEYRDDLFPNMPIVFMGINTEEKANLAHKDPLITGMIECFPYNETIALACSMYPKATKIVGISDNTESGQGCAKRFFDEKDSFPFLEFSELNASEYSKAELAQKLSELDSSTILVFLALVNDGDGNVYSLVEATEFVEQNSNIPMFKADMIGIGDGVLGGYVSSYEEMGKAAARQAKLILEGKKPSEIPVGTMGGYPLFDQKMIDKYNIEKHLLSKDSVILNRVPSLYEQYKMQVWVVISLFAFIVIFFVSCLAVSSQNSNKRLKAEIIRADSATHAKSDFLSRMSHEIRTPMNAIVGLTTIAKAHIDDKEKVNEYLGKIDSSSKVLLGIINDVLDMSAIENSKLKIANAEFDLKKSIEGISDIYYTQCRDKGITFKLYDNIRENLLIGDALRVNQVLLNLVSNAYKFTSKGGSITVSADEEDKTDDRVSIRFTVSDTGIGMSEDMLSRLFKPFEQESAMTAQKSGGSGLGMSIAKSLVELMGGKISAQSKKGQGSTFTVIIPFGICKNDETSETELKKYPQSFDFSGHKLLLAEDNEINTDVAKEILGLANMACDHAQNGKEAVEMFTSSAKGTYDLILMDVQMPEMDGYEASRAIRQSSHPEAKTIPIFAMTANAFTEDVRKAMDSGMNGHLAKPIDTKKLYGTIYNCLNGNNK